MAFDAGAFMLVNTSGAPIVVNSAVYDSHGWYYNGVNLWGSFTIGVGQSAILTQTSEYNFDTSEAYGGWCCSAATANIPTLTLTIGGVTFPLVFSDTGLVSTTGNFDLAGTGRNEELGWRLIGTTGIDQPQNQVVPEPASIFLLGSGLFGGAGLIRRKLF
jgi:hypothetical protein